MIRVSSLSKYHLDGENRRIEVLRQVSLEVASGTWLAITGRSGSGKSTLLHILGGLDAAFSGEAVVDGVSLAGARDEVRSLFRQRNVGLVFQSFHLVAGLTAAENVMLPAAFAKSAGHGPDQAKAALERVGLADKWKRMPSQLSGGEKQRVAIARALFLEPKVLLCDEPTGSLDASTRDEMVKVFSNLHRAGLTLVVVTHERVVADAAQRRLTLEQGVLQ